MSSSIPVSPVVPDSGRWKPVQRGYPVDTEVLTSVGWVLMHDLFNESFLGEPVPFVGNNYGTGGFGLKTGEWGQWKTNDSFPLLASVDPDSGRIVFGRPEVFIYHSYAERLVRVKMKGVDFMSTLFSDLWVLPRYGRKWKYVLADDVVRAGVGAANFGLLNKFNVDMYGWWTPEGSLSSSFNVDGKMLVGSELMCEIERPIKMFPRKHTKRVWVWDMFSEGEGLVKKIPVYNVVNAPYHNLIIRKTKSSDSPRVPWVGGPVVVGDGLDKSLLRLSSVLGGGKYSSGSYRGGVPVGYRTVDPDKVLKSIKEENGGRL